MRDRYGRVIINPNASVGLDEFQQLYMGEGASPEQAAHNIFQEYPMEARGYLDQQWKRTGIAEAPEQYFSRMQAANPAAYQPVAARPTNSPSVRIAGPVSPVTAPPAGRLESIMNMQAAGALPYQAGDREAAAATVMANDAEQKRLAAIATNNPLPTLGMLPPDLLKAQLAGDTGEVKAFLLKQQGVNYQDYLTRPINTHPFNGEKDDRYRPEILPYNPEGGVSQLGGTNNPSRLDTNIFMDRDFQTLLAKNPAKAQMMYQRLTGRDLSTDYKETINLRQDQLKSGRAYATRAIYDGAKFNPVDQTWKVWNISEPEGEGTGMSLSQPRPSRQLVDATNEQANALNQHYSTVTGSQLPVLRNFEGRPVDNNIGKKEAQASLQQLQNTPVFQQKIAEMEHKLKRPLLNTEVNFVADQLRKQIHPGQETSWWDAAKETNEQAWRDMLGISEPKKSILEDFANKPVPADSLMGSQDYSTPGMF